MEDYIVSWVISGVLFWTTTFLLVRNVFRNRSFDFCNRVVSTVHAAVAVGLASLSVQHWGCPVCPLASRSSELQVPPPFVHLPSSFYSRDRKCASTPKYFWRNGMSSTGFLFNFWASSPPPTSFRWKRWPWLCLIWYMIWYAAFSTR